MATKPNTVYARDGDAHLAYQVVGDRDPDLLFVPTATFPIDLLWDEPIVASHLRRLTSFNHLITTDLLGLGSSDVVPTKDLPAMQSCLKRLRNSAIHGGPISETACQSVAVFAFNLGHQCLNEAMRALLTGIDIPSHMEEYRSDHIDRFERVKATGDIDALFVVYEPEDDESR